MKLSVIIPTYNRCKVILQTLPTVLDQTFPASEYEVIVVVDGSTDGTAEALKQIHSPVRLHVIEHKNRGLPAARNTGLKVGTGDLVLFLDDDLFCERTFIAEHVAAHIDENSLVRGAVRVAQQSPKTLATEGFRKDAQFWESRLAQEGMAWPWFAAAGANSSARRETILIAGGYDERFFGALEDWELGQRLWKAGVRFRYCPSAVTYQFYVKNTDDVVLHDSPFFGANYVLLCQKHPEFRRKSFYADYKNVTGLKFKVRELCVRLPFSLDPLLRLAERTVGKNPRVALRIFNVRRSLATYRGLIKAFGGWGRFRQEYVKFLPVLMYHHVGPVRAGTSSLLTIRPEKFRKQMGWLKRKGYTTIRTGDWLAWCNEGKPLPEKPVLITFDDAYEELAQYAFPVLREFGFTATVFVVTGEIGGQNTWDQKSGSAAVRCMSEEQIRKWSGQGIEFGAHSRTHAELTTLPADKLEDEIAGSGRDLAQILGAVPLSFAYPFGMYNEAVRCCAEKFFQLAFTMDDRLNGLGANPHMMRRTTMHPCDSLVDFLLKVRFGFSAIERALVRLRLRSTRWELK